MKRLVFDVETNGLLFAKGDCPPVSKVHCLCIQDVDTGEHWSCADFGEDLDYHHEGFTTIPDGIELLNEASLAIGHNILGYDHWVLCKLYPSLYHPKREALFDTLNASRLIWTDLKERDFKMMLRNPVIKKFLGRHSLKAWGHRLGILKGEFDTGDTKVMSTWSPEMQKYCEQDVKVTCELFKLIESKKYSRDALKLEFDFQFPISLQDQTGFCFDRVAANRLNDSLYARKEEIERHLRTVFPDDVEVMKKPEYYIGKKSTMVPREFGGQTAEVETIKLPTKGALEKLKCFDIKAGPLKTKAIPFNPGSALHIADRFKRKYQWTPTKYTDKGLPEMTADILRGLPFEEAKLLIEYDLVEKRLGLVSEGPQSWLKNERGGRLYGEIVTNGTITGRCGHKIIANVPKHKDGQPYGSECRKCFVATPGWVLVGTDAAALELRCLAHFMHEFDGGTYSNAVLNGSKEKKTTVHHLTQQACKLNTYDEAKTFNYKFLYGSGDQALGDSFYTPDEPSAYDRQQITLMEDIERFKADVPNWKRTIENQARCGNPTTDRDICCCLKGAELKKLLLNSLPALAKVVNEAKREAKVNKMIVGIDGRKIISRSQHSALNFKLQSAGALAMKKALCILYFELCPQKNWTYNKDFRFVTNYHDEIQAETKPEIAEEFGRMAQKAITMAGEYFKFRCPLSGESKIGTNWHTTH